MTNYITKTIKNGVEANIPVTSVNWQYGDVVVAWKEYNAWQWIEIDWTKISAKAWTGIGVWTDYSAMRWPCPDGFHVPKAVERIRVFNSWITLWAWTSTWWNNASTYLKLPFAGYRLPTSSTYNQGTNWYYQTCGFEASRWLFMSISESLVPDAPNYMTTTYAHSLRPFKDIPSIPDSSWTVLYQWTWTAWIYHNSQLWLISISSDWTTRYTIADKNLWATAVYNFWDTLSQSNCGNYYQWWNNYWFPRTWSVTTSSTRVDASWYWPSSYNSSTFITAQWFNRDTSNNANLWWWVTWAITYNWITNTGVLSVNWQTGNISNVVINDSTGSKSIVKVRWWTQAEYDALATKDSSTLYFTTDS